MTEEQIKEWYAEKTNRSVYEFDEYDLHVCRVLEEFWEEVAGKEKLLERIEKLEGEVEGLRLKMYGPPPIELHPYYRDLMGYQNKRYMKCSKCGKKIFLYDIQGLSTCEEVVGDRKCEGYYLMITEEEYNKTE